jgi:hypothetical protein
MVQPAGATPTFEELYAQIRALPEHMTGEILEPGVLRTMSRPGKGHRRAARACLRSLDPFDANVGGSGWWIEAEVEIRLPQVVWPFPISVASAPSASPSCPTTTRSPSFPTGAARSCRRGPQTKI